MTALDAPPVAVPFVDLSRQHRAIEARIGPELDEVMARGGFTDGPAVAEFEAAFARFSGARHGIGVASGTDALELALRGCGIGPGDEVLVPANSFAASAEAVVRAGADPVFVDVDPASLLIDVDAAAAAIGPSTAAVLPVHLYGQPAPMVDVTALARRHGLAVVVDAAQAQGALDQGEAIGVGVDAAATSFYPTKNLGAYGDGGAVVTDRDDVAALVRSLGHHGVDDDRYRHVRVGCTSRLDTVQAIVLRAKLEHLNGWNADRRDAAARYDALLPAELAATRPATRPGATPVFHLYVLRVADRERVLAELAARGIGAGMHYPIALHRLPAFEPWAAGATCPRAEGAAATVISLPMFPGITARQQALVVDALLAAGATPAPHL